MGTHFICGITKVILILYKLSILKGNHKSKGQNFNSLTFTKPIFGFVCTKKAASKETANIHPKVPTKI